MSDAFFFILLTFWLICGVVSAIVASNKNLKPVGYFFLGVLFGPFGLLIAVAAKAEDAPAPSGQHNVSCPRCLAKQTTALDATSAECWQCKTKWSLIHNEPVQVGAAPGWYPSKGGSRWWDGKNWRDRMS